MVTVKNCKPVLPRPMHNQLKSSRYCRLLDSTRVLMSISNSKGNRFHVREKLVSCAVVERRKSQTS
jgi:hypothetical protein